jgi:hypothetical protein
LAEAVREKFSAAGLTVSGPPIDYRKKGYPDQLRRAVRGSRVYVAIVSRSFADEPRLLLEGGAAWATRLPIYILRNDILKEELPDFFQQFRSFSHWDELPRLVKNIRKLPERVPA